MYEYCFGMHNNFVKMLLNMLSEQVAHDLERTGKEDVIETVKFVHNMEMFFLIVSMLPILRLWFHLFQKKFRFGRYTLALYDRFRGQTTEAVSALLSANNIVTVRIPANCTNFSRWIEQLISP